MKDIKKKIMEKDKQLAGMKEINKALQEMVTILEYKMIETHLRLRSIPEKKIREHL